MSINGFNQFQADFNKRQNDFNKKRNDFQANFDKQWSDFDKKFEADSKRMHENFGRAFGDFPTNSFFGNSPMRNSLPQNTVGLNHSSPSSTATKTSTNAIANSSPKTFSSIFSPSASSTSSVSKTNSIAKPTLSYASKEVKIKVEEKKEIIPEPIKVIQPQKPAPKIEEFPKLFKEEVVRMARTFALDDYELGRFYRGDCTDLMRKQLEKFSKEIISSFTDPESMAKIKDHLKQQKPEIEKLKTEAEGEGKWKRRQEEEGAKRKNGTWFACQARTLEGTVEGYKEILQWIDVQLAK